MTKLTANVVNQAKPGGRVWDDELKGFHLKTTAKGAGSYVLAYRNASGKQRWLTLGRHGAITPQEARSLAKQRLGEIAGGGDPAADKKANREAVTTAQAETFGKVVERFLAARKPDLRKATLKSYTAALNRVPNGWKRKPVNEIGRKEVIAFLDALKAAGRHPMTRLTLRTLNTFFGWCFEREIVTALPTTRIRLASLKPRERALPVPELKKVWAACDGLGMRGDLVRLLILTGQRRGETGLMKWTYLAGLDTGSAVWTIPSTVAKNKKTHVVPLPPEAVSIIKRQPRFGEYVFTFDGKHGLSGGSLERTKQELDKLLAEDGQERIEPWRLHDLRRSVVTGLHEHGLADPHTIELIVNHVGGLRGGIAGVYDRSTKMDARRKALEAWARLIVGGEDASNVVPLRRQA